MKMTEQEAWQFLLRLDHELLLGNVMLSEWCSFIVREADTAFARGVHLASILTAVSGIETYLRSEARTERVTLKRLIDEADVDDELRQDLHSLRQYRNKWVHVEAPWDDEKLLLDPAPVEKELETMSVFAARVLRRTLYSIQGT
jgi:hypothetical protein